MTRFLNFMQTYPNFAALFQKGNLPSVVCRFYEEDGYATLRAVVGYTELRDDILLHTVEVEDVKSVPEAIQTGGLKMCLLSTLITKYGFDIIPIDQFDLIQRPKSTDENGIKGFDFY